MIPKIIHYCWFGGGRIPESLQVYINSWSRVMPDYELRLWDDSNIDISSNRFAQEAYDEAKWAFVSDYFRLDILYREGGIYLDTDVLVKKRFDPFLEFDFFSAVEYHKHHVRRRKSMKFLNSDFSRKEGADNVPGIGIQSAILGSVKGNQLIKDCMDLYTERRFILGEGDYNDKIIAPDIYAVAAEKYGFKYMDAKQYLQNNMVVFPSEVFAGSGDRYGNNVWAVHFGTGSWREKKKLTLSARIINKIERLVDDLF